MLQYKHRSDPRAHLALRDIERELPKLARHVHAGDCDVYVLMTNAKVSATTAADVKAEVRSVGVKHVIIHGYEAICELLGEHKQLRAQVPRLYGLGDLTEILDERAYAQTQAVLAAMHDDLARIVPVAAHQAAHRALGEHRFTLLLGPPGSGKTAIAASLAMGTWFAAPSGSSPGHRAAKPEGVDRSGGIGTPNIAMKAGSSCEH